MRMRRCCIQVLMVMLAVALPTHARLAKDKSGDEEARAVAAALDRALGGGTNFSMHVASRDSAVVWHDAVARDCTPPTKRKWDTVRVGDKEIVPNEHGWVLEIRPFNDRLSAQQSWPDFHDDGEGEIRGFIGRAGVSGGKKVEIGRGVVLRYGKSVDKALFAALCTTKRDRFSPLAVSLLAQAMFHRACDDWEPTALLGEPTAGVAERLLFAQRLHVDAHLNGSPVIPNAAVFVPHEIAYAGKAVAKNGQESSYVVGLLSGDVVVGVWWRGGDALPSFASQGVVARLAVQKGANRLRLCWRTKDGPQTLRFPYTFGAVRGELTVRFEGQKWLIEPDQGIVTDGQWRLPEPMDLSPQQTAMVTALGGAFELVSDTVTTDPRVGRFWLATVRCKRAGEYVLRCKVSQRTPVSQSKSGPDGGSVTAAFRFSVGKSGEVRSYRPGLSMIRTYAKPFACVGDSLVVPVVLPCYDTTHQFTLSAPETEVDRIDLQCRHELWKSPKMTPQAPPDFDIHNRVSGFLRVQAGNHNGGWNIIGTQETIGYQVLMQAMVPGQFNLGIRLPGATYLPDELAIEIVLAGTPLTIPLDWWEKETSSSGPELQYPDCRESFPPVHRLRVGDRIVVDGGALKHGRNDEPTGHPVIEIESHSFKPLAIPGLFTPANL